MNEPARASSVIRDKRSHDLLFTIISANPADSVMPRFLFTSLVSRWFGDDEARLVGFLEFLDGANLKIGPK